MLSLLMIRKYALWKLPLFVLYEYQKHIISNKRGHCPLEKLFLFLRTSSQNINDQSRLKGTARIQDFQLQYR